MTGYPEESHDRPGLHTAALQSCSPEKEAEAMSRQGPGRSRDQNQGEVYIPHVIARSCLHVKVIIACRRFELLFGWQHLLDRSLFFFLGRMKMMGIRMRSRKVIWKLCRCWSSSRGRSCVGVAGARRLRRDPPQTSRQRGQASDLRRNHGR